MGGPGNDRTGRRRRTTRLRTGWRVHPATAVRRVLAVVLFVTSAVVLAVPGGDAGDGRPTLVTARDLPTGATLTADDVRVVDLPGGVRPAGVFTRPAQIEGRRLGAGARAGEPLTDARLVSGWRTPEGTTAVPVRLADAGVAGLLRPGAHVRLLTASHAGALPGTGPDAARPEVLAERATVVTVFGTDTAAEAAGAVPDGTGPTRADPLALVAVAESEAPQVAAASLDRPVTVLWH